jgi:urease accessory protein UreG
MLLTFSLSPPSATVTNDIFTREDQEFLIKNRALPADRILAIETGGCPHAAIREDISANMGALETLQAKYECQLLFVESGGDNLAANYSRELADYIIYVIDVSVCFYFPSVVATNKLQNREEIRFRARVAPVSLNQICSSSTR